jgi:hypothetical protein
MGGGDFGSPNRAVKSISCVDNDSSLLPLVASFATMGHAFVRVCCEKLSEMNNICPSSASSSYGHRKRVEELITEVDDARQENQRLNKKSQHMRLALKDGRSDGRLPQEDPLSEEALQLKRVLGELQRENNLLRQSSSESGRPGTVSISQYQALQTQVQDLQRALNRQQGPGMQPSGGSNGFFPSHMPPPPRYDRGSRNTSGYGTPMTGTSTPQGTWSHGGFMGGGSSLDFGLTTEEEEMRRRVMAMQAENEKLRRKVRMLASN